MIIMNDSDQAYELNILKIAINKYLDQKLTNSQKDLEKIELNKDEFVWEVVTKIHNQSGYKVSISFARDIIEQRIIIEKEQLRQAEEKARLEIMRIKAEQEEENLKIQIEKQRHWVNFYENLPEELKIDETKLDIFMRIQTIICEDLAVDPSKVNWNSHLSNDLGADTVDLIQLVMTLEEEFNIEISDAESEEFFYSWEFRSYSPYQKSTGNFSQGWLSFMTVSSAYSSSSSQYSSEKVSENCIVKYIVNLIHEKL